MYKDSGMYRDYDMYRYNGRSWLSRLFFLLVSLQLVACTNDYIPISEIVMGVPIGQCPGVEMAATCGNGVCDAHRLETADTCPYDCTNYSVSNNSKSVICAQTQSYDEPTSLQELGLAVATAVDTGKRIKVTGTHHSYNEIICGDGATISTASLDQVFGMTDDIVYVEPGVKIGQLADYLHEQDKSVGLAHIGFRGITVAGSIGTSAHGSGISSSSVLADKVVSMKVMGPDGQIVSYSAETTEPDRWRALLTNLGMLGIVVEIGIQTEEQFNLDTLATIDTEDNLLNGDGVLAMAAGCDFFQVNWMPYSDTIIRWCGQATQASTTSNGDVTEQGRNGLLGGLETSIPGIAREMFHLSACHAKAAVFLEKQGKSRFIKDNKPMVLVKTIAGDDQLTDRALGYSHKIVSADYSIPGGPYGDASKTLLTYDWEVAVPQQHIQGALNYVNNRFVSGDPDLEESGYNVLNRSLPPIGMFLRFSTINGGGLIGYNSASSEFKLGEVAMFLEIPAAMPFGFSAEERAAYNRFFVDTMKGLIDNFGARVHWGKNNYELMSYQIDAGIFSEELEKFRAEVLAVDPYGVFGSDLSDVLGVEYLEDVGGI